MPSFVLRRVFTGILLRRENFAGPGRATHARDKGRNYALYYLICPQEYSNISVEKRALRMIFKRLTEKEKTLLDNKSTENMILFYEPELRLIAEGENAKGLINKKMVKRFLKSGILEHNRGDGRRRIKLSRKGRKLYGLPF